MKKRMLVFLMAVLMIVNLLPATALAAEDPGLIVAGVMVTAENKDNILPDGDNDGKVTFDSATNTLTLEDGTNIEVCNNCVYATGMDLIIVVGTGCTLTSKNGYAAVSVHDGSLTIRGNADAVDPSLAIVSSATGIDNKLGDVIVDNCSLDIDAVKGGIYCDNNDTDEESPACTGSVTVQNCAKVDISAQSCAAIYAGGVWTAEGETYRFGGNLTIDNCDEVTMNNAVSGYSAMYAFEDVNLTNCHNINIDAGWNGVYGECGVQIDSCDSIDIRAVSHGIMTYADMTISDSKITSVNALPSDAVQGYCTYSSALYSETTVTVTESELDLTAAKLGQAPAEEEYWHSSYGIFAYDLIIENSNVTTRGGSGDNANGINIGTMQVTGKSTVNAYGGEGPNESYGLYAWEDVVLDGNDVELNLYCGDCCLEPTNEDYYQLAYFGEWWYDDENSNALVAPSLTVQNGATLNADSCVWSCGDITVDDGKVHIATEVGSALVAGGYEEENTMDTYFGKLTVKNGSSVIATTVCDSEYYSAVYAYDSMDIRDSELFASATSGAALGCPKDDHIKFYGQTLLGSTETVAYDNRRKINSEAGIGYSETMERYTALIENDVALTVYVSVECKYAADFAEGENVMMLLGGREAGKYSIKKVQNGYTIQDGELFVALSADGKSIVERQESYTWKFCNGLYGETGSSGRSGSFRGDRKTTRVYLAMGDEGLTVSSRCVKAQLQVSDSHNWACKDNRDGETHTVFCTQCGMVLDAAEGHDYCNDDYCECGAFNPEKGYVSNVKVTEKQMKKSTGHRSRKSSRTAYQYTITPKVQNVCVSRVEYSDNYETWNTGKVFNSDVKLNLFYIRITDSNGKVTEWKYENGEVTPI